MRKLLVMLGLAAVVVSANASNNSDFAKKCRTRVRHGQLKMKGKCARPVDTNVQAQPDNNVNNY